MLRQRPQLNPAFAKAHGIGKKTLHDNSRSSDTSQQKIDAALRTARTTAHLTLSSCSLNVSLLPDAIFDLRGSIQINLDMDSSENPGPWESVGEDQITHLDISDNGSKRGCLDNRLQKLLSLQNLRARRSNISSISWHSMYNFNELVLLDLSCNELEAAMLEYLPVTMRDVDLSKNKLVSLIDPASNEDPVIVLPNLTRLCLKQQTNQATASHGGPKFADIVLWVLSNC